MESITSADGKLRMRWSHALILVLGYVALDWASYIHALHGLNITPWSPAPAICLAFVLRHGPRAAGITFVAIVLADLVVRDLPTTLPISLFLAAVLATGYGVVGEMMRRRFDPDLMFANYRRLLSWIFLVVVGTACVSAAFAASLMLLDLLPGNSWREVLARYWIGDAVGVLITMPLFSMLMDERGRSLLRELVRRWDTGLYAAFMVITVWITLGASGESGMRYFYVAFVPIVWAALRGGLPGAVFAAALAQLAIIAAVQFRGLAAVTMFEIQSFAVVLAVVGFLVGAFIDEHRRMGAELRQSLRLAAAGEMAAALAHELNQPLTAMTAYGAACEGLVEQGDRGDRLLDMVRRMVAESRRTADVVSRLRDFFRTGDTRLEHVSVAGLLGSIEAAFEERAQRSGADWRVQAPDGASVWVDRLQIEVVLRNLVANAFDAVEAEARDARWVRLSTQAAGPGRICIVVEDSGPGPDGAATARLFEPFRSSKSRGLGLGLAISRSIAEAHGGRLWAETGRHGTFKLLLPLEQGAAA